jgi:hypothetical protein
MAVLGLHGLPASRFLTTTDHEERVLLQATAKRAEDLHAIHQRNLAVLIVSELGKALRRG